MRSLIADSRWMSDCVNGQYSQEMRSFMSARLACSLISSLLFFGLAHFSGVMAVVKNKKTSFKA